MNFLLLNRLDAPSLNVEDIFETRLINGSQVAPLTVLKAAFLGVKPGTNVNPGYVLAVVERLPERLVIVDLKKAKKN